MCRTPCRLAVTFLFVVIAGSLWSATGSGAQSLAVAMAPTAAYSVAHPQSHSAELVKHELCGRGLGGRCLKGRNACTRGTPAQCERWKTWSAGCTACATEFATCRGQVGHSPTHTCDTCLAAHDACEAENRASSK